MKCCSPLILVLFFLGLLSRTTHAQSWRQLSNQVQTLCPSIKVLHQDLLLQDLHQYTHVLLMNPRYISHKILSWVENGGYLLIAWELEGLKESTLLMEYLDLEMIPFQKQVFDLKFLDQKYKIKPNFSDAIEGVWWHPQHQLSFQLAPWLSYQPIAFKEGSTWFTKNIHPIAVTYGGLSFAYRVKIGSGILTFMGDSDALSDRMFMIPQNKDMSKHMTEWFMKTYKRKLTTSQCKVLLMSNHSIQGHYIDTPLIVQKIKEYIQKASKLLQSIGQQEGSLYVILKTVKFLIMLFFLKTIYRHRFVLAKAYQRFTQLK